MIDLEDTQNLPAQTVATAQKFIAGPRVLLSLKARGQSMILIDHSARLDERTPLDVSRPLTQPAVLLVSDLRRTRATQKTCRV